MQDLDIIVRNNAKAVEEHVLKTRNAAAFAWNNAAPGNRTAFHNPATKA